MLASISSPAAPASLAGLQYPLALRALNRAYRLEPLGRSRRKRLVLPRSRSLSLQRPAAGRVAPLLLGVRLPFRLAAPLRRLPTGDAPPLRGFRASQCSSRTVPAAGSASAFGRSFSL